MREGAIRLRHPVRVFLLLYGLALALRGEDQLGGEPLRHVLFAAGAAERDQPAHAQGGAPLGAGFHRELENGRASRRERGWDEVGGGRQKEKRESCRTNQSDRV